MSLSMRDVLEKLVRTLEAGQAIVLCQVVETRGSTPQKAGAIMTIDASGVQRGTLGGGCIENEVVGEARRGLVEGRVRVHRYILDHDYAWADGLVCGGRMTIVTQPLEGEQAAGYFRTMAERLDSGVGFTEVVAVEDAGSGLEPGARWLIEPDGRTVAAFPNHTERPAIPIPRSCDRAQPAYHEGLALLPTWPRITLLIVGAGHVGQATAALAAQVDFDICVLDDRRQFACPERFPTAREIHVGPIEATLDSLAITPSTYALIVTRGHGHDEEALERLAPTRAGYVGLIGSRRKIRLILNSLLEKGVPREALLRVSAPVGIDIGSRTVPEIAVSIVAELIAWRNTGRRLSAPSLLDRPGARAGGDRAMLEAAES